MRIIAVPEEGRNVAAVRRWPYPIAEGSPGRTISSRGIVIHLLHVIHRYPPALGGSESYAARLGRFHADHGDTVTVYTSTANDLAAMRQRGPAEFPAVVTAGNPEVHRFAPLRFPGRRYVAKALSLFGSMEHRGRWMPCSPLLNQLHRHPGPERLDAVHGFAFPYANPLFAGLAIARRRKVPFFLTPFMHWGDPSEPRDRTRRQYTQRPLVALLHAADAVFVQTAREAELTKELGVMDSRIVLQGLGVESNECTQGDRDFFRGRYNIAPDAVVVGHLANLSAEKGTNDLIAAFSELSPDAVLLLAGERSRNYSRPLGRGNIVELDRLTECEKRHFFAAIDIFALPSRSDSFGLVLLEAWANGIPNVVYYAGGPGELVRHETDGLLVPCGDIGGLRGALRLLIADPMLRRVYGTAGKTRIAAEFAWPEKLALVRDKVASVVRSTSS